MSLKNPLISPPKNFTPAGTISCANFCDQPSFIKPKRSTGARANGLRYEKKAKEMLSKRLPHGFDLSLGPWVCFKSSGAERFCQLDAFAINEEKTYGIIFEIKLQHTSAAWWQVRQLYEPLVRAIHPQITLGFIEIVKWLDPHAPFPETFYYAHNPFITQPDRFGVHIFDGRKKYQ